MPIDHHASLKQVLSHVFFLFSKHINIIFIGKRWLDLRVDTNDEIVTLDRLENEIDNPPDRIDEHILDKIQGSLIGLALGDTLGAHVEFRPRQYLVENPVEDLEGGGTWGLQKGQVLYFHSVLF